MPRKSPSPDSVDDATIFQDIVQISGGRVKIPEGLELSKISADTSFSRPGIILGGSQKSKNRRKKKK